MTPFANLQELEATLAVMAGLDCEEPGLSELEHGLQCAAVLRAAHPRDLELQIAGLVHDIRQGPEHDRVGADAVRPILGERVAALVGMHVKAKRYLVSTDAAYRGRLSPVSIHTLGLQGGVMSAVEISDFEAGGFARDAVELRRADDAAKVIGKKVAGLEEWLPVLRSVASARSRNAFSN